MKGVQCYELFGGIAHKIHTFSFFILNANINNNDKVVSYWSFGLNVGFWLQRQTVRTPATACCFLEQDTLSALLQSTQL